MKRFTSCYQGIFGGKEIRPGFDEIDIAGGERSYPYA
jgi:hypothetical protein